MCGPKGKHNVVRPVRHGTGKGSVTLGGRRVPVERPRARTLDGHEVPLTSYTHFAADDMLTQVMERMLAGLATVAPPSRLAPRSTRRRNRPASGDFAPVVRQTRAGRADGPPPGR